MNLVSTFKTYAILAFLSIALTGCASTPSDESTGQYLDGTAITAKVKSALALSSDTSALQIEVETFKNKVQLAGFVDSQAEKDAAEKIASGVDDVVAVDNALIVK